VARCHASISAIVLTSLACAQAALAQTTPPSSPLSRSGTDPTSAQRALAETLFYAGKGLMQENQVARACEKFAESYRLDPTPGTLLNLGVCHEQEGKLASAWGEFRQAIAEARRSNRPDREELAKAEIAKIEPDLPFVKITVPREVRVPGLSVSMNGVPLEEGAWELELPVDPGTSEITALAPNYKQETKHITIEKRQHLTLQLAPLEPGPPPFMTTKRVIGFSAMAAGVALAGAGAAFGVMALNNKSTSNANCPSWFDEQRCTQAGSSAMSTAYTDAWVADIGIGVGAAAFLTGAALVLFGGQASPATTVGFTAGPRGGEGVLTHSF
jgi:hypothetical protein